MTYTVTTPDNQPPTPALAAALHELATRAYAQVTGSETQLEVAKNPPQHGGGTNGKATHGG